MLQAACLEKARWLETLPRRGPPVRHLPQRAMLLRHMDTGGMTHIPPPPALIDLDALDEYLMSDHAPDDSMGLSDLDGFLTGIVVGPELIPPREWLPLVWGGVEPEFRTEAEMRTVLSTIMGRYNQIIACFSSAPYNFAPIFWEGPVGEVIASDWAGGFMDAVELRPLAWKPLMEDENVGILLVPLFILNGDLEPDSGPDGVVDEDEVLAEAADMIPTCVAGIYEFWRNNKELSHD